MKVMDFGSIMDDSFLQSLKVYGFILTIEFGSSIEVRLLHPEYLLLVGNQYYTCYTVEKWL